MANLRKLAAETTDFRYVPDIDDLDDYQLSVHGYYRGFPCVHGHLIRDTSHHWCYHCVHKIKSNRCGFDINYLHIDYKAKCYRLWSQVEIREPDNCWGIRLAKDAKTGIKRVHMPSYRSEYSNQKCEHVSVAKALYQCAWGDVGKLIVSHACGNKFCCNPLHLTSSWNRAYPPNKIYPLVLSFEAEKLMMYGQLKDKQLISNVGFRMAITNPLEIKDVGK